MEGVGIMKVSHLTIPFEHLVDMTISFDVTTTPRECIPHLISFLFSESESCEPPPVGKLSISKATPHQQMIDNNQRSAIIHFLKDLNNEQLVELGLELRLHYSDLQKMKTVPETFPKDMIATWQREKEKTSDPPSWTSLAAALEAIGQKKIITKIEGGE